MLKLHCLPLACTLLPLLLGSSPAAAHQAPDEGEAAVAPATAATADLRRVLHLAGGGTLRARSRCIDGVWEVRSGAGWERVGEAVSSAVPERDLLAEMRRREGALNTKDAHERAELARWLIRSGLPEESFRHLDRLLREDPASPEALAVLREAPHALDGSLPAASTRAAELAALLRFGAGASPARVEAAIERLRGFEREVDLASLLRAELKAPQPGRRTFALAAGRRLFPHELVRDFARRALLDGMGEVRAAAAEALRACDDPAVLAPVVDGCASRYPVVRNNAVEALGAIGQPAAVEPLVRHLAALAGGGAPSGVRSSLFIGSQTTYVMDYDMEIAQGASIADPILAVQTSGVVLDARAVVQITREVEIRTTIRALKRLTGEKGLESPRAWNEWWSEHSAEWSSQRMAGQRGGDMPSGGD